MKAKMMGSGWHKESLRHSNARRLGRAGGFYRGYSPQTIKERSKPFSQKFDDNTIKDLYYYRMVWRNTTGKGNNGLFEKFMASAFKERAEPHYAKEWAERFASGNPTPYMDNERKKIYLELLKKDDVYDESLFPRKFTQEERAKIESRAKEAFR